MRETAGKAFARKYFFECYLPGVMSPHTLRNSNFLLLLGEDFRELPHLKALDIEPYRVFSVERDLDVFQRQKAINQKDDLGFALYYGELADYIRSYMFTNHQISVLNLDICGSFMNGIDPVMGKLLHFARRNSSTVMATYSSAGRDKPMLEEGVKALILLMWLAPSAVERLVQTMYDSYAVENFAGQKSATEDLCKNMVLRHMYWLNSYLHHVLIGSYELGYITEDEIQAAFNEHRQLWLDFVEYQGEEPITFGDIIEFTDSYKRPQFQDVNVDMSFGDVQLMSYSANQSFFQNCYFVTFECSGDLIPLQTWLVETALLMRRNEVLVVDAMGNYCLNPIAVESLYKVVLWKNKFGKPSMVLPTIPPNAKTSTDLVKIKPVNSERKSRPNDRTAVDNISEKQARTIKAMARKGLNSNQICAKMGLREELLPNIRAYMAAVTKASSKH